MAGWTFSDIPPQGGRTAVVTGTGGLGYETALALARAGADVILAGRNAAKGAAAVSAIKNAAPNARIQFASLDLANLASVRAFSAAMSEARSQIDLLVNNAGVMALPKRQVTADGFEMQFGTNYLGHFALTAGLLPLLRRGHAPHVVALSSLAHRGGKIHFDDLQFERNYRPWAAYQQSKLAMLMFARELQRRSDLHGWGLMSNAAHPGFARTELIANGPGTGSLFERAMMTIGRLIPSQSAAQGALPTLYAATAPQAEGGAYYGPGGFYELTGAPKPAKVMPQAKDEKAAARLWDLSEKLTGASFADAPSSSIPRSLVDS